MLPWGTPFAKSIELLKTSHILTLCCQFHKYLKIQLQALLIKQ